MYILSSGLSRIFEKKSNIGASVFGTPHTACRPVSVCLTGLRASPRLSLTSNFIFCKKFPIFEFIFPIFAVCFLYFFNNLPHFLVFAKMQLFRHTKSMQNQNSAKNLLTSKRNSAIMRAYPVRVVNISGDISKCGTANNGFLISDRRI